MLYYESVPLKIGIPWCRSLGICGTGAQQSAKRVYWILAGVWLSCGCTGRHIGISRQRAVRTSLIKFFTKFCSTVEASTQLHRRDINSIQGVSLLGEFTVYALAKELLALELC
jgi:hypothetical protein